MPYLSLADVKLRLCRPLSSQNVQLSKGLLKGGGGREIERETEREREREMLLMNSSFTSFSWLVLFIEEV